MNMGSNYKNEEQTVILIILADVKHCHISISEFEGQILQQFLIYFQFVLKVYW